MTNEASQSNPLEVAAAHQREEIKKHLTKFILQDKVPIDDERSFFQLEPPEEDAEAHDLHVRAGGDPGLYALYWAMDHARHYLEEAQIDGQPAAVEKARSDLQELAYLEQAYTDPQNNPYLDFESVDPSQQREGRPLSDERDHLDYADVTNKPGDPPF